MVGCHASCKKYIDWAAEEKRLKEEDKKKHEPRQWIPKNRYYDSIRRLCKKKGR